jgi:hypothetical protein
VLIYSCKSWRSEAVPLTITCQWCEHSGSALAWEQTDRMMLLHLVPLFRWRNVFVQCQSCRRDFIARCSIQGLQQANPLTLQHNLIKRVSFVAKACAVLGLLLCWAPLIGIIPATIALLMTRRRPGWVANASVVAFVLSALSSLILLLAVGSHHR